MAGESKYIKLGEQESPTDKAGTSQINRIYPIDDYIIPEQLVSFTARHHFLRVPLLGQHNPINEADDWCGRTSASMVWNYHHRVSGAVRTDTDYISHWRGPDGRGSMNLRSPGSGNVSFVLSNGSYSLLGQLKAECGFEDRENRILKDRGDRDMRLQEARNIRASLDEQRNAFAGVLGALIDNNPVVLHTGLSTSDYGGHIVVVCGFCEMADRDGRLKLWLLIADPAPPKTNRGPTCTPVKSGQEDDCKFLEGLDETKNSMIMIHVGDWTRARGYLYLLRASKLFEQNSVRPREKTLWLDDLCNAGRVGGSYYHRVTPTALDPELVLTKNVISSLSLPLEDDPYALVSPVKYYINAEEAGSGFYPLGSNQAMHGGVHLPQPAANGKPSFVKSIAPGYIVAARLTRNKGDTAAVEFLNNHNGFVLVRHEMIVDPEPASAGTSTASSAAPATPLPFYSLYMHMPATRWPESATDAYSKVPWLRRFYLARHGAVLNLDPQDGPIGAVHWVAEQVSGAAPQSCRVHASEKNLTQTREHTLRDGDRYLGYFKEAPGDLRQACKALEAGTVVTFANPFLVVQQGEVVGVLQRDPDLPTSGSLHWEILAPASEESAIAKAVELGNELRDLGLGEVSEVPGDKKDNLLEKQEIESLLKDKLPAEADQERLSEWLAATGLQSYDVFKRAMARFMAREASFAKGLEDDELIEPQFKGSTAEVARLQKLVYPFAVTIDNGSYRVAPTSGRPAPYHINVTYLDKNGGALATATKELTDSDLKQPTIKLRLKVPATAATMELVTPSFHLDTAGTSTDSQEAALAQSMMGARWRGVTLKRVTEWSPAGLRQLVPKLRQHKLMPLPPDKPNQSESEAIASVMPTAWYGVPRGDAQNPSTADGPVEVPILGPDGQELSLFDPAKGMLPASNGSAEIHNIHPVTFIWLLKLLQETRRSHLVTEFEPVAVGNSGADEGKKPIFWGWISDEPRAVGRLVSVVAVRRDWGAGPVTLCAKPMGASGGQPITLVEGMYEDGFFSAAVSPYFWGTWKLEVKDFEQESVREQGARAPLTIDIPKPRVAAALTTQKNPKTNLYTLGIHFTENCPDAIGGYIVYEHTKITPPADTDFPESQNWVLDAETGGYITGLKNNAPTVAGRFTLANFLGAPGANKQVSTDLARAAAKLCAACRMVLQVTELGDDGRSATLVPLAKTTVQALTAVAQRQDNAYNTTISVVEVETDGKKSIQIKLAAQNIPAPLPWTELPLCNPVYARRVVEADGSPLASKNGFYTGLEPGHKDARVTPSYMWSAYSRAGVRTGFKLAMHLAAQVEALTAKTKIALAIRSVTADGLSVGVRCDKWEQRKASLMAAAAGLFTTAVLEPLPLEGSGSPGDEVLALTVAPPPVVTAGWMQCELDPRDVFGEILKAEKPKDAERVWIKARFVARNADRFEVFEGPSRVPGTKPGDLASAEVLTAEFPGVFKSLGHPGFGALTATVAGKNLVIRVPLEGARADWTNARPAILVNGTERPSAQKPGPRSSTFLECAIPLDPAKLGAPGNLAIETRVGNPDATFDGERVAIAPATLDVSTMPRLEGPLAIEERQAGRLTVSAAVHCCPAAGSALQLRCKLASSEKPAISKKDNKTPIDALVRNAAVTYPAPSLDGVFEAHIDVRYFVPGERYVFELGPSAAGGTILGVSVPAIRGDYGAPAPSP